MSQMVPCRWARAALRLKSPFTHVQDCGGGRSRRHGWGRGGAGRDSTARRGTVYRGCLQRRVDR